MGVVPPGLNEPVAFIKAHLLEKPWVASCIQTLARRLTSTHLISPQKQASGSPSISCTMFRLPLESIIFIQLTSPPRREALSGFTGSLRPPSGGFSFISNKFLAERWRRGTCGLFQAWNDFFPHQAGMSAPLCCSICFLTLPGSACSARRSSYVFCRFIQNSAVVSNNVARRTAVSPVIPRCP